MWLLWLNSRYEDYKKNIIEDSPDSYRGCLCYGGKRNPDPS